MGMGVDEARRDDQSGGVDHHPAPAATSAASAGIDDAMFRQMVENMPINVMICDLEDFKVTYANPATLTALRQLEHATNFNADDLIGSCIDIFHKDPSFQRGILANPGNLPHQANIEVGGEILDLLIAPVKDPGGKYIAVMVTWSIVTQKIKADAKAAQLTQMIEEMPVGVYANSKKGICRQYETIMQS